jgi:L-alanine-DL-glutamate epimerase-like enolase superfamily enzyme
VSVKITAVRATPIQERVLWAREMEELVSIRGATRTPTETVERAGAPAVAIPGSILVEVETDAGITGLGLGGGGWPGAYIANEFLAPLLLGEDTRDTERLWERMYRRTMRYGQAGIVLMAISGVDLALWDAKAKALEQPVYRLLGGRVQESLPVYATVRAPEWVAARHFDGIKLGGPYGPADGAEGMARNEAYVAEVRERVGPDMEIMIDCASTWNVGYTLEMARRLASYRISFIEEPVPPHDVDGYARLRNTIGTTRIAGGEHAYTRYAARQLLERGAVDVLQPDIRWTGGLSEVCKIVDLAAAHDVPVMPHRGGMAWSLHLMVARPNCPMAEGLVLTEEEAEYSLFEGEPVPVDGRLDVSEAPGFGLTLRPEVLDRVRMTTA